MSCAKLAFPVMCPDQIASCLPHIDCFNLERDFCSKRLVSEDFGSISECGGFIVSFESINRCLMLVLMLSVHCKLVSLAAICVLQ